MNQLEETLKQRAAKYGEYKDVAATIQALKSVMHESNNWYKLTDTQKESLEMVAHKIGRILNGDPNHYDSWHDIMGYTKRAIENLPLEE